eukprot:g9374.t1
MYHSGLEVGGVEYTFSEAGIGQHPPRQIAGDGVSYKTTEVLGDFIGSMPELRRILNGLKDEGFKEGGYDVVRNNCNHFCDELAFLLVGKRIPTWVNRAATIGTWAGLGESKKDAGASADGSGGSGSGATASAPPSRERKELTQKQRDLLAKMKTNKSSAGRGAGGGGGGVK